MPAATNANKTIIKFDYNHAPTLWNFAEDNSFVRAIVGPLGSGKSSGCAVEVVRRGLAHPPGIDGWRRSRWAIVRDTVKQLEDTTMKTFFDWFPPHQFGEYKVSDGLYTIKEFSNCQIEVMFRALERPDQISDLLSLELTGGWVNEGRYTPWAIIDAMQGRLGRYPAKRTMNVPFWYGMWIDTNAPDADSDFYKFFEEKEHKPGFAKIFHQPSGMSAQAENIPNLPGGRKYYENLMQGKSQEWINVYIHGRYGFVADGRPVFPEFSEDLHLGNVNPIPGRPIYRGWDASGFNPACTFSQLMADGRWLVFDELCGQNIGAENFIREVSLYSNDVFPTRKPEFIDIGDPAGTTRSPTDERTYFSIMKAQGINIMPGIQTLAMRLECIRKPLNTMILGKPQFILNPRCKVLRKGFMGAYRFRRVRLAGVDRFADIPDKNFEANVMDALQYPATILFGPQLLTPKYPAAPEWEEPHPDRSEHTGY